MSTKAIASIKPACTCGFPFAETGSSWERSTNILEVSLFTSKGYMIFTNRQIIADGSLADMNDISLVCTRCGNIDARWK